MSDEDIVPLIPTLLEGLPRTDPEILKQMGDYRIGEKHYAAIGRVAASWAYVEAVIDTWIWRFAEIKPNIGVCLTGQMIGPRPRLDAFIAIVRESKAKASWNERLEELAKNATGLAEQRNRTVHDLWELSEPSTPIRREATAKKTVRLLDVHVPTDEMIALVTNIYSFAARFDDMASTIFTELHTTRDKC